MAITIESVDEALQALEAIGNACGCGIPLGEIATVLDGATKLIELLTYNQVAAASQIAAADITANKLEDKKFPK